MFRCYSELIRLPTLRERFEYLRLNGEVGEELFGYARYLNQEFYHGSEWMDVREQVILRDQGRDLGVPGWKINGRIYVHHMNPITLAQLKDRDPILLDPENLICVCLTTHNAIHYGDETLLILNPKERRANDTCPWKR